MTPEEEKKVLASSPVGTWVVMATYGVIFVVTWLAMYGLFLSRGPVH